MIAPADMSEAGYAYGRQLAVHYARDIASLRTLARTSLNSPPVSAPPHAPAANPTPRTTRSARKTLI